MKLIHAIPLTASLIAGAAWADAFSDPIVADLQAQGYSFIEVKTGPNQTKIEAIRGSEELELVFDRSTGEEISREMGIADDRDTNRIGVQERSVNRDFERTRERSQAGLSDDDDGQHRSRTRTEAGDDRGGSSSSDDSMDDDSDDDRGRGRGADDDSDDDRGRGGRDDDSRDDNSGRGGHDDDDSDDDSDDDN